MVLADTEDVWRQVFESSGKTYVEPKLVLYTSHPLSLWFGQRCVWAILLPK